MRQTVRIAVNLVPQRDRDGIEHFKAALPMGVWFEKGLDKAELERAQNILEEKNGALVAALRALRPQLKAGDVLRYWMFGDPIIAFEKETENSLLFVDRLSDHLARDVNYSKTMIDLCRRFRIKLPNQSMIDPLLSFVAYHRSGFDPRRAASYSRK